MTYLLKGHSLEEAFRWGLAAATASCKQLRGASFDLIDMQTFFDSITIQR